jgi:hypothetical protein
MPYCFHLKVTQDEALNVNRWLFTNIGNPIEKFIPRKNIAIRNWECHFQYGAYSDAPQLMVEIFKDPDAVSFKLAWYDLIVREKKTKLDYE